MRYNDFKKIAQHLSMGETEDFVKLEGLFGQRPFIDVLETERVRITARGYIGRWVPLSELRIDTFGNIFLKEKVSRVATEKIAISQPIPETVEATPEAIEATAETDPTDPTEMKPPPDFDPLNATDEEVKYVMKYNKWLKDQGRADEQIIPF